VAVVVAGARVSSGSVVEICGGWVIEMLCGMLNVDLVL
jgi:hypothetical protein